MFYPMAEYKLIKFKPSSVRDKKYDAILKNNVSQKLVKVSFGHSSYSQYKDSTGLNLFSHKDHGDIKRRKLYHQRHAKDIRPGYYSPGFFSMKFLW
jgi:hypothetical protein